MINKLVPNQKAIRIKKEEDWIVAAKLNINKPIKRELSVCSLLRNSHLKKS